MNKVIEVGYLTKKGVELKFTPGAGKAVATYSLAVPRAYQKDKEKKEYDYINCVTWNGGAEWLANNQGRVKRLLVEGRLQTRSYDGQDGTKRYVTEVITNNVEVMEWGENTGEVNAASYNNEYDQEITPIDDGEIPF